MSHTRLVFMVLRTSVTVCKSVLTYSLLHVVATRVLFDLRIAGVTYARTHEVGVISLPFGVNYYRGRINANEKREKERTWKKNVNLPTRCINQHTDGRSLVLRG